MSDFGSLVARTEGLQPWRRVFHAVNGIALALVPGAIGIGKAALMGVLAAVFVVLVTMDVIRLRSPQLNAAFFRAFSSLASPREASAVASSTWYALGALLTWGFFPAASAAPAILVLGLADPAASVIGRRTRGRPFGKGSVPGSFAFFAVALVILLFAAPPLTAVIVAALAALMEVIPWKLDDNLTVPVWVGLLLTLMMP